jgi:hypothetical protein
MLEVSTGDPVSVLIARDLAARARLDDPAAAAELLQALREVGARKQADRVTDRLPAAGMF